MKCIYWNTKGTSNLLSILDIIKQESPDILFLSETLEETLTANVEELNKMEYEHFSNPGCDRIVIIKKKDLELKLGRQSTYYSALKDDKAKVNIISVHFPSQMFNHIDGLKSFIRDFRNEIDAKIGSSLSENIMIIGDFNVNPFETPMIDFDGFSASNTINLKGEVSHLERKKALYYNPTWLLYRKNHFPGTKYFKRPSGSSFDILEHHFLDQVVLSFHMSKKLKFENIDVLEKTRGFSFFDTKKNKVTISDHLPLIYEFKLA